MATESNELVENTTKLTRLQQKLNLPIMTFQKNLSFYGI